MPGKKDEPAGRIAVNRRARHDYFIEDRIEAGLALQGWEVKSMRAGKAQLTDSYVIFRDGEAHVPKHLSKEQDISLKAGDRVRVGTPGGGGYGDPRQRDPAAVRRDVELGYYTSQQAAELFGVDIAAISQG